MAKTPSRKKHNDRARKQKHAGFSKMVGSTGATLHILRTNASHGTSMSLLEDAGLRPLTYHEVLPMLMQDKTLREALKGEWFWLAGQGARGRNWSFTVADDGELVQKDAKSCSKKMTAHLRRGSQPLSLIVHDDEEVHSRGSGFLVSAAILPSYSASTVVGVPMICEDGKGVTSLQRVE